MKINLYLFSSLFILLFCYETDFELQYSNFNERDIISSFRKTFLEIDVSFGSGSNSNKYKLTLDPDCHGTVIPGINSKTSGNIQKYKITDDFKLKQNISVIYGEKFYSGLKGEDTIQIGNSEPIKNKISFVVASEFTSSVVNLNKYAFFGLKNTNNDDMNNLNIINQMKVNNLINYPTWFLSFNSDSKGKFIIGTLPHQYDNITYNEENMIKENCKAPCSIVSIQFQDIYYGNKNDYNNRASIVPQHTTVFFSLYTRLIQCTPDYGNIIHRKFFEEQIKNGNCHQDTLSDGYLYYYCEKKSFSISSMENLNFVTSVLSDNMTFVLEPKDLFYEKNGIYYFLIIYKPDDYLTPPDSEWIVGSLFLQKYLLTFNRNEKVIYFYKTTHSKDGNPSDNNDNGKGISAKYIIIIVILCILLLGISAFLIYYIIKIKPRKKRANELVDDFDYQDKQNEENATPIINDENNA